MQLIYKKIIYLQKYCQKDINTKNIITEKHTHLEINAKDNRNNFRLLPRELIKKKSLYFS